MVNRLKDVAVGVSHGIDCPTACYRDVVNPRGYPEIPGKIDPP